VVHALRPILVLTAALALSGCVEVTEKWNLESGGGGTYDLTVRWQADLWRRVADVLGERAMKRIHGAPFPMRAEEWRDGLKGLKGVEIQSLGSEEQEHGWRKLSVKLHFQKVADVFQWEVLSRRTAHFTVEKPKEDDEERIGRLHMTPLIDVPVLDPLAALLNTIDNPPPAEAAGDGGDRRKDPPPLERLGIDRSDAELVGRMLKPELSKVKLRFELTVPGVILSRDGRRNADKLLSTSFEFDFAALRNAETDRRLRCSWHVRPFDEPSVVANEGTKSGARAKR